MPFTDDATGPLGLHLIREGGHGVRRIAHAADATGKAIHDALLARAAAHPNITLREQAIAVDLITSRHVKLDQAPRCHGVYALDIASGRVETLAASAVVLATGGIGKVYRYTTNPDTATGDGIGMAWRAPAPSRCHLRRNRPLDASKLHRLVSATPRSASTSRTSTCAVAASMSPMRRHSRSRSAMRPLV